MSDSAPDSSRREDEACPNCGTYSWAYGRICPGCREVRWEIRLVYIPPNGYLPVRAKADDLYFAARDAFDYLDEDELPPPKLFTLSGLNDFDFDEPSYVVLGKVDPATRKYKWWHGESPVRVLGFELRNRYTGNTINYTELPWVQTVSRHEEVRGEADLQQAVLEKLTQVFNGKPKQAALFSLLWEAMKSNKPILFPDILNSLYGDDSRDWSTIVGHAKEIKKALKSVADDDPIGTEIRRLRVRWKDAHDDAAKALSMDRAPL